MRRALLVMIVVVNVPVVLWTPAHAQSLSAAVLPSGRSVKVGTAATAFATIINAGSIAATGCSIALGTSIPATFLYQTTEPSTNMPTGAPNTPVAIQAGHFQTFFFAITPTATFNPTDVRLVFDCDNTAPALSIPGVNTLLLSSSAVPVPDMVALAATASGDGIVTLGPAGAFAVATVNAGIAGSITATVDTGTATLPVSLGLCRTDSGAQCQTAVAPSVTVPIGAGETPTFSVFGTATGPIPFDPGVNRAVVRFKDGGGVTRGSTSVALKTPITDSLAGLWYVSGNGTAVSDTGDSSPFSLVLPPFRVAQSGSSLSGTVIAGDAEDVLGTLPASCTLACPAPGSCSLTCPGLSCNLRCTPATAACGEENDVTGTVSGLALSLTLQAHTRVDASCSGVASGTLFAEDATVTSGAGTIVPGTSPTATGMFSGRAQDSCGGTGDFAGALECVSFNFSGIFNLTVTPAITTAVSQDQSQNRAWDAILGALSRRMVQ
jgi:hypothetical protein